MFTFDLVLVGFGNVARRFVRLLEERADAIHRDGGFEWRVVGIATRRHGAARDAAGLDAAAAAEWVERGERLDAFDRPGSFPVPPGPLPLTGTAFIEQVVAAVKARPGEHRPVVVETTVLDVRSGQPAIDHVRAALRAGADLVTANKGPAAFAFAELDGLARAAGRSFLFEGAVMDGIPIFNLARETLPAVRVEGLRGVVNSTTNYIITAMERGREFDEALAEMQAAGIAEADPSLDVDGWDAAAKTAALANVLMGAHVTPLTVSRSGIAGLTGADARAAVGRGRRIKLVSRVARRGSEVTAAVRPEELPADDLLATLSDQQNALVFETGLLGDFSIVQLGGGLVQTAYGLLSDLVSVRRRSR